MTGDQNDFRRRLRLTLPTRWFADAAPVLDGLLSGLAANWVSLYQFLQFVIGQSRVRTATGEFIDMAAQDYLSGPFPRRMGEGDEAYRTRLLTALGRLGATRPAIVEAATAAGYSLTVFEAAQPADTGAYSIASALAWNVTGAWGSMQMPLESLIVATPGIAAFESELWRNLALATPAGGAIWLRVQAGS